MVDQNEPSSHALQAQIDQLNQEMMTLRAQQQRTSRVRTTLAVAFAMTLAGVAIAGPTLTPFNANTPAVAAQINTNFTQLAAFSVPSGAILFVDADACPTGWTAVAAAQGRMIMGRPSNGTLRQTFGGQVNGNSEPSHAHGTGGAGGHSHTGSTGGWAGWVQTTINYNAVPGYNSPYHIVSALNVDPVGDHTHGVTATGASSVVPYVYFTPCRKD